MNQKKPSTVTPKPLRSGLFAAVKEQLTTRQAAEQYGLAPDRRGMVCCPFHADRHPSMKVDERFHCFGCQADGDVIDFAARLFGLAPLEAARKLAEDFGLVVPGEEATPRSASPSHSASPGLTPISETLPRVAPALFPIYRYQKMLERWVRDYAPAAPGAGLHPLYCEAVHRLPYYQHLLEVLSRRTLSQQRRWISEHHAELAQMKQAVEADRRRGGEAS